MIEFKGDLSESNKRILGRIQLLISSIAGWITALLIAIPITFLAIRKTPLFALGYIICAMCGVFSSLPIKNKYRELICPNSIIIGDDNMISSGEGFSKDRNLEDIKRIDDYGDHYRIVFSFPYQTPLFLCQKDLIVEGTIEEFEERFSDLIVGKAKG